MITHSNILMRDLVMKKDNNYSVFMGKCNTINAYLVKKYNLYQKATFGRALIESKKQDTVVQHYWEDLQIFLELRNLLAHKQYGEEVLASPSQEVIQRISEIQQKIVDPTHIGMLFKQSVISFDINDSLGEALEIVRKHDYTQFPIFYNRELVGLLSENGITRWLSRNIENNGLSVKDTKIYEVLNMEECKLSFSFISPLASVYEVETKFANGYKNNNKNLVLLVTNMQNPHEASDLIAIITYADLQLINRYI
jgi:predicted transcriptional regulator